MDFIGNLDYDPEVRANIRGRMLPAQPYQPRPMTDISLEDLPACAFTMYTGTRQFCETVLCILSIFALFIFWWLDNYMVNDMHNRLLPYSILLSHDQNRDNTQLKDLKSFKMESAASIMTFVLWVYIFLSIARLVLQYFNFREEVEDYTEKEHSSIPLLIHWWITIVLLVLIVLVNGWVSRVLGRASTYSGDILSDKMDTYALGDADLKMAIDRFQMNYECCGSVNYTFWYQVDLYQFPDLAELAPDDLMREYLVEMFMMHYDLHDIVRPSAVDLQNFIEAHRGDHAKNFSSNGVESPLLAVHGQRIYPIGSLPFSCCRPMSETICPFYNHQNLDHTWKDVDLRAAIFTDPCNEVVQDKLKTIGLYVDKINLFRFVWETVYFLAIHAIKRSFESHWFDRHRPTISGCPNALFFGALFGLTLLYISVSCHFFSFRDLLVGIFRNPFE